MFHTHIAAVALLATLYTPCAHADQDAIHMNAGRQPEAIMVTEPGAELKALSAMPMGEVGPWRFLLTLDAMRSSDTGERDASDQPAARLATRRISHVEMVLETSADSLQGEKRTYFISMPQAAIDSAVLTNGDSKLVSRLDVTTPDVAPAMEGAVQFTRTMPSMKGVRGKLVMDRDGWIDSLTFEFPDEIENDAITLSLDIERALRGLMPPMPSEPVGHGAEWVWNEWNPVDGVLVPTSRTVEAEVLLPIGDDAGEVTFKQFMSAAEDEFDAVPAVLAFVEADVESKSVSMTATGKSRWLTKEDAAPIPHEAELSHSAASSCKWRSKDAPDETARNATTYESVTWKVTEQDGASPAFAVQSEALPEYAADPIAISTPREFDQAVGFMEQIEADLDLALQPGGEQARQQAGEGDAVSMELNIAKGQAIRAKIVIETTQRQEAQLATVDRVTASHVQAIVRLTVDEVGAGDGPCRGTITIESAKGVELDRKGDAPVVTTQADQAQINAFLDKPIAFTLARNGAMLIEQNQDPITTADAAKFIVTDVVEGLRDMQIDRPVAPMSLGQTNASVSGADSKARTKSLRTTTCEGLGPRVLRQTSMLRAQPRENDLFLLTPLIAHARVATSYYDEIAVVDSDAFMPSRAKRGSVERTIATYERDGMETTGQRIKLRVVMLETIE